MKVTILGLWHLGSVTAACLAAAGHDVVGWDPDSATVRRLAAGNAPVAEPGLDGLLGTALAAGNLRFTSALPEAVRDADIVWIAFDTAVDEEDRADVEGVLAHVRDALPHVKDGCLVISSSQLPVGTVARIEREFSARCPGRQAAFACCPENLRLGKAIAVFTHPDRIVAGVRGERDRAIIADLFAPITDRIEWMSVESAEMTKHAINAFLATSVAFINEIAAVCEAVGADAKEVERGLKTDQRIGGAAYLSPGAAFAGGTLARDLVLLEAAAAEAGLQAPLVSGARQSNCAHATWTYRTLAGMLGPLEGRRVGVWGLTYKPGTDTLRRSSSVELCRRLARDGARVTAFDPSIRALPGLLAATLTLAADPLAAADGADAVVVATEWPVLREVTIDAFMQAVAQPIVVDPGRFLASTLGSDRRVRYVAVGTPRK
jgi:UDPglucose 6-dehydrogenase